MMLPDWPPAGVLQSPFLCLIALLCYSRRADRTPRRICGNATADRSTHPAIRRLRPRARLPFLGDARPRLRAPRSPRRQRASTWRSCDASTSSRASLASPGARSLEPAAVECLPAHGGSAARRAEGRERGEALLRAGRVAVLVVAGGQGTRLGFDAPKGVFPLGPATGRTLFELQAQKIRGARRRFGARDPLVRDDQPRDRRATRAFFAEHKNFGLPERGRLLLLPGHGAGAGFRGRLLLESPGRIAESPNGHGGSFQALADSGALDDMRARGITTISYYQVDNPLIQLADPVFLGLHDLAGAEMSAKVVRKLDPMEKVGVLARVDGRIGIVEYTEIDDEHRFLKDASGAARLLGRQHRDPRDRRRPSRGASQRTRSATCPITRRPRRFRTSTPGTQRSRRANPTGTSSSASSSTRCRPRSASRSSKSRAKTSTHR